MLFQKARKYAIYINEKVAFEVIHTSVSLRFTSFNIRCFKTKKTMCYWIYKSPSTNNTNFLNDFEILVTCLQQHKCVIFGDLNKELLQISKSNDKLNAIIAQNGFNHCLVFPSRVTSTNTLLVDCVFYN